MNSTILTSSKSAQANDQKALENAKPPADEHPVVEDGAVKEKPVFDRVDFVRNAQTRVKLCVVNSWNDKRTGYVACVQSGNQPDAWWIVVRHELNEKNILESRILTDNIYFLVGATIVWKESDVCDLALSFQRKAWCKEVWHKICQIQGKDPYPKVDDDQGKEVTKHPVVEDGADKEKSALDRIDFVRQTSESNRKLTVELNTLEAKNQGTLERNRELEQELSNSLAKIRDLEAKFDQAKLSSDNAMKEQELIDIHKKLVASEKRIAHTNKENAVMAEKLKSWEDWYRGATEFADGVCTQMGLDPIVPPAALKQQIQEEEVTELGPDGDSANGSRIDTQKKLEEVGVKNAANVASGSKAGII